MKVFRCKMIGPIFDLLIICTHDSALSSSHFDRIHYKLHHVPDVINQAQYLHLLTNENDSRPRHTRLHIKANILFTTDCSVCHILITSFCYPNTRAPQTLNVKKHPEEKKITNTFYTRLHTECHGK